MRLLPSSFLSAALATVGAAQSPPLSTWSDLDVFAQADTGAPRYSTIQGNTAIPPSDPAKVRVDWLDNGSVIAHARTSASLRMIGGLPAARVFEHGWITPIAAPRQRAAGTAASLGSPGSPHTLTMLVSGAPGTRVRVHSRLRSTVVGRDPSSPRPTAVDGRARVDVGRDGSFEFDKTLDGNGYLGNTAATIDATGVLRVGIELRALLSSTNSTAASYSMTLDVLCEPIRGMVTSMEPYGPVCGPDLYGVTWDAGGSRFARLLLDGAPASTPALLAIGVDRLRLPIPGMTCDLLTTPLTLLATGSNAAGRIVTDFPAFPASLGVVASFQYGMLTPTSVMLSKGIGFRAQLDSAKAYDHFDVNHVLSTGQSLAIGGLGAPVLSSTQTFNNLMFSNGVTGLANTVAPLVESGWETMSSGMASLASQLYRFPHNNRSGAPNNTHDVLVSVHAEGGQPYVNLKKGSPAFAKGISQFRMAKFIAESQNLSYVVRCVTNVHGETDHTLYNADYAKNLVEWQRDYETEIQSWGQTEPVPMLHSQMSSFTRYSAADSIIPGLQLQASVADPRRLPLVGPKYFLDYIDGVHLTSQGYRHMGEYYGKVYNIVIVEGATWEPLRPLAVIRSGARIDVRFHVPVPPLVVDTTLVTDPGNLGFEYTDDSGSPPAIRSVALVDEDTVRIELTATPKANAQKTIAYAHTGTIGANAGPRTGARGNLRDSDSTPSLFGNRLHNWAVHFAVPVQ